VAYVRARCGKVGFWDLGLWVVGFGSLGVWDLVHLGGEAGLEGGFVR
jgi:hypothetical protein